MTLRDHVPLRDLSSLRTGGVAEYYCACESMADILSALQQAETLGVPHRVLGAGTGVLMSDGGYPGLVAHAAGGSIHFLHDRTQVIVETGVSLSTLVSQTLSHGYSGLEFLNGMPGTVGSAVYGNTSLYGLQLGDYVKSATVLMPGPVSESSMRRVDRDWFTFDHRTSLLKQLRSEKPDGVIPTLLTVTLQLSKMSPATCLQKVNYYAIQQLERPSASESSLEVFDSLRYPTQVQPTITHRRLVTLPVHTVERIMVRQWQSAAMHVFTPNPNFIVNNGMGTSREASDLLTLVQDTLESEYGRIEPVVEFFGIW